MKKGQEAAPFNLIIAGIMITFAIVVLAHLALESNTTFCLNELRSNVENLAREIEKSAQYSRNNTELTANLNFKSCGNIGVRNFTIEELKPTECIKACGTSSCRMFQVNGEVGGSATNVDYVCLKLPFNTTVVSEHCQDYGAKNITNLVFTPKVYKLKLIKRVGGGETAVEICDVT